MMQDARDRRIEELERERDGSVGWLIESTLRHDRPRWWQGKKSDTEEQWTVDAGIAVRFARREDAESCRLTLGDAHVSKVTEHMWLAAAKGEKP